MHTFFLTPCAAPELLTRLRLLITSVFRLIGRGRPCSLRNRPQALHSTEPTSSRLHRGVVEVPQFPQIGGCEVSLDTIEEAIGARMRMGMLRFGGFCYRGSRIGCDTGLSSEKIGGGKREALRDAWANQDRARPPLPKTDRGNNLNR